MLLLAQPVEGEGVQSPEINKTIQSEEIQVVKTEKPKKGTHGNLGQRNNNPLNITYGRSTKHWVEEGKAEIVPGHYRFLKFYTEEDGWKACEDLLKGSYADMTLESAMRKWSGGGYGAEVTRSKKRIADMNEAEFEELVHDMASREGWFAK